MKKTLNMVANCSTYKAANLSRHTLSSLIPASRRCSSSNEFKISSPIVSCPARYSETICDSRNWKTTIKELTVSLTNDHRLRLLVKEHIIHNSHSRSKTTV